MFPAIRVMEPTWESQTLFRHLRRDKTLVEIFYMDQAFNINP